MRVLSTSEWRHQSQLLDERDRLKGLLEELRAAATSRGDYEPHDVTDDEAVARVVRGVEETLGPVTGILHGAGVSRLRPFKEVDLEDFRRCIRIKATGLYNLLRAIPLEQLRAVHVTSSVLGHTGMDPRCLELEITESLLVRGDARLLHDMRELRALGIRFSIDDFGTGYSSLSYLKRLPVSSLKADRSFVHDVPDDSDNVAILAATISMAHNLNLEVVAEGVETDAQLEFLRAQGCDELQGFLISRPLDAASIEPLLHADHRVAGARPSHVPTPLEPA